MADDTNPGKNWSWEKARHLLFRAGFGGKSTEIQEAVEKGLDATVESLVSGPTRKLPVPRWLEDDKKIDPKAVRTMTKDQQQEYQKRARSHIRELQGGWVQYMITAPTPADMLHEKMAFFWHGHFASSAQKVKAPPFVYEQLKLFHDKALGNYGELLHAIIRDPAMLVYLDNPQNRKGKPNENLGRELMELFSLGTGNYTEQDIREGARALTGWHVEPYQFVFRKAAHDDGAKTIFGQTGKFSGDEFVNLILEQPACAKFMTKKLWVYFASENPKPEVLDELARTFRDSKYDIKSLLKAMFTHPEFYSPEVMGTQFKSPVQLIVGTARTLNLSVNATEFYGRMLMMMGQAPYLPPNVKGWPGGKEWIDTSRLLSRYSFASIIGNGKVPGEIDPRMQGDMELDSQEMEMQPQPPATEINKKGVEKLPKQQRQTMMPRNLKTTFNSQLLVDENAPPKQVVDHIVEILLPIQPSPEEQKALVSNLEKNLNGKNRDEAIQKLVGDIMMLPAFQLY
jgi:uncharacterized protein (DUF1800 family)